MTETHRQAAEDLRAEERRVRRASTRRRTTRGAAILLSLLAALALGPRARATEHEASAPESEPAESTPPMSPSEWLSKVNEALLPDDSMVARVKIVTHDGFGGDRTMLLDVARVSKPDAIRTLIEVEAPEAGAGTTYEIVAPADGPLRRRVWLPELRRLREITGLQRTDHFLGTEFTYEDLGFSMPVERGEGTARWVGPDGQMVLESPPYHYYGRVLTHIAPSTGLPTKVSFYDHAGQLFREQRFEDVREVDGRPFPTKITVRDLLTGASSVLTFESLEFGVDVPAEHFANSAVRRRLSPASRDTVPDPGKVKPD